ncbi:MAG: peptidoglycan DD-metalloendopeptidase family protein [Coriobacteriia bacterium]|nr:peptidoglycan DD-metalloendopeptidase family protein [Coriobacteriia bacterium]
MERILLDMERINSYRVQGAPFLRLLRRTALCVCAFVLIGPATAVAVPRVSLKSYSRTLKKSISPATYSFVSNETGTAVLSITDSKGRYINRSSKNIAKGKTYSLSWNGRVARSNAIGKESNDYVSSGTYRATIKVTGKSGVKVTAKSVRVTSNAKPTITAVNIPSSVTPSAFSGAKTVRYIARISRTNDIFMQVIDQRTKKIITQKKYRDKTAGVAFSMYWDGQINKAGSVKITTGASAVKGDVAPPGKYTLRLVSNGASYSKTISVKPAKVASAVIGVSQTTLVYGSHEALTSRVIPRGVTDSNVTWKSSNTSLATVGANGVVTAKSGREGSVAITATSILTPTVSKTTKISISSGSKLKVADCAVAKWCLYGYAKTLPGTVSSNSSIKWVSVSILNEKGEAEISKTVKAGDPSFSGGTAFSIKNGIDKYISFAKLSAGKKTLVVTATDEVVSRTLYSQTFWIVGPTRYKTFWTDRVSTWAYPLDGKNTGNTSAFGSYRDGGARAHAAIDLIEPVGTKVYAMTDGVVERISVGTYYAGTGAVQVKNTDGSVIWYCEVKAATGLKVGSKVKKNQLIAAMQLNHYGTSMLHLEAYSGKSSGNLSQTNSNDTYDNVTAVHFNRRRDLISPMGVLGLNMPSSRTVAK